MRKLTVYSLVVVMLLVLLLGTGTWTPAPVKIAEANPGTNWNATYFNTRTLSGTSITRIDDHIDFNWGSGSPDPAIPADDFSARWTKTVSFPTSGQWTFRVGADDGIRMWVDATLIIDQWHDATGGYAVYEASLAQLTAGNHDLKVEYYEATGLAGVQVSWSSGTGGTTTTTGGSTTATTGGAANWNGEYFNNANLTGSPALTRTDPDINFNWADGSPAAGIPTDNFSVRWTATVNFPTTGRWHFKVGADDGVRMWIDSTIIVDQWHGATSGFAVYEVDVDQLTAGDHALKVEYYEATGLAGVQVRWWSLDGGGTGATAVEAKPIWAAVTADLLNVRTGPGQGYPVIAQVVYPENYPVLGAVPDMSWVLIDLENGSSGWVTNDWVWLFSADPDFVDRIPRVDIAVAPPAAADLAPEEVVRLRARTLDTVNIRDGASNYARKIGSIPQSAEVIVEARNRNGAWYLMTYQGIRGWIYSPVVLLLEGRAQDLLISSEVVPVPAAGAEFVPQTEAGQPVTVRGRATAQLILRDAASVLGNEIGRVPADTELVIEGRNTTGAWYLVTFGGVNGWVYSPYVTLIQGRVQDLPIR
ncbi:MAG: SH3 domain-containing protein [Anaerolineae bacterium]|nr:SH3 domain-containing protein [Anaerolineae bacterium]